MVINIIDIVPGADTGTQGRAVFLILQEIFENESEVVVSFAGIDTATSSFVNNAFVSLLDEIKFDDIKSKMKVINSGKQINDMIKARLLLGASR